MESEYEVKPQTIKSQENFERMAEEMLKGWDEYKSLRSRMELLDASVKKYMIDNNKVFHENAYGSVTIVRQTRRVLDRSLIEDIEKYKVAMDVNMAYKSTKKQWS